MRLLANQRLDVYNAAAGMLHVVMLGQGAGFSTIGSARISQAMSSPVCGTDWRGSGKWTGWKRCGGRITQWIQGESLSSPTCWR